MAKQQYDISKATMDDEEEEMKQTLAQKASNYKKEIAEGRMTRQEAAWRYKVFERSVKRIIQGNAYRKAGIPTFIHFETEKQAITDAAIQNSQQETEGIRPADL